MAIIVVLCCMLVNKKVPIVYDQDLEKVELEGLEPSSKRGTNVLSTCVFFDWFSCSGRPKTTNLDLIL